MSNRPFSMRSFSALLLCVILVILLVGATGKGGRGGGARGGGGKGGSRSGKGGSIFGSSSSSSSGSRSRTITSGGTTRTYTYTSTSSRNYNNGARYYNRYSTVTTTSTFGYSYYRSGSYYYSGYGYRMYYPPTYYYPIYVGYSYYYYPPMFYLYHRSDRRYWNGNRPRYTCRNDNAFWPLENQTNEFVDGRPPAVDFTQFEGDLPDPDSNANTNWDSQSPAIAKNLTELNSLEINEDPSELFDDYSSEDGANSTSDLATSTTATAQRSTTQQVRTLKWTTLKAYMPQPSETSRRKIMAYNYFVCPDGKDPDEIYCCGPSTAQYCCTYEEYSETETLSTGAVVAIIIVAVVVLSTIYSLVHKFRHHCMGIPHSHHGVVVAVPGQTIVTTRETVEYIPAPDNDGSFGPDPLYAQGAAGVPPVYPTPYPAGYQPVSDAPPSYAATQNPAAPVSVPSYPPPGAAIYPSAGVASYPTAPTNTPYPASTTAMPYPAGPTGVPYPSLTSPTLYVPASSYMSASNIGQYPPNL